MKTLGTQSVPSQPAQPKKYLLHAAKVKTGYVICYLNTLRKRNLIRALESEKPSLLP